MRTGNKQPLVAVDAGNLLFKNALSGTIREDHTSALIAAHGIVKAYKTMSYDAVAVSPSDLSAGLEFFQQAGKDSFPWISANVFDKNTHLLFPAHIIKNISDLTIGIIGLTGGETTSIEKVIITDWREPLKNEIAFLEKSCDMLVVLSNLTTQENNEILQNFNHIDIIVSGDKKGANMPPQVSHNSLVVQSGGRGKYIGKLDITYYGQGDWRAASSQSPEYLKNKLSSMDLQISQLERQQSRTGRDFSQKIARLKISRQILLDQIARESNELNPREKKTGKSFNSFFLPVKPISAQGDIGNIVQDIKKNINTFNQYRRLELQHNDSAVRLALQDDDISGVSSCFQCHKKQAEFWKNTRHAKAYATLSQQGQSFNLQCLPCHVTAGKVSATSDQTKLLSLLTLGPERQTIGCEVCHGSGKKHLISPGETTPVRLPPEEICKQCHTSDRDINFVYQEKLSKIACPSD